MIEYAVVLQLYQKPDINFQEAVQRALAGPRVVAVSEPPQQTSSLDERLASQSVRSDSYTLDQVKELLSKPYLKPRTSDIYTVYNDLMTRGEVIKYALNRFPINDLREMNKRFAIYLLEIINFKLYLQQQVDKAIYQELEFLRQYLARYHEHMADIFRGKKPSGYPQRPKPIKLLEKTEIESMNEMFREIFESMKAKELVSFR